MIKAVVFDLWNTLAYNKGANPIGRMMKRFKITNLKAVEEVLMTRQFKDLDEALDALSERFHAKAGMMKPLVKQYLNTFEVGVFEDVMPVLKELKKSYKLGLVSNSSQFTIRGFRELFKMFDARCLSYDVGMIKPDPEIFRVALKQLGVKPEEAVMVGDNLHDDILPARMLGMQGVLIRREMEYERAFVENGTDKKTITDLYGLKEYVR